jgi:DNA polymerase-3 subunit alpha
MRQTGDDVFDLIEKFAGYGFNKIHSAAYALITFQTAYLKAHYPVEFMAALLTTERARPTTSSSTSHEARTHGIEVLPPDINISMRRFGVDYNVDPQTLRRRRHRDTAYGRVRFGLGAIKGLGDSCARVHHRASAQKKAVPSRASTRSASAWPRPRSIKKIVEVLDQVGRHGFVWPDPRAVLFAAIDRALDCASSARKKDAL